MGQRFGRITQFGKRLLKVCQSGNALAADQPRSQDCRQNHDQQGVAQADYSADPE